MQCNSCKEFWQEKTLQTPAVLEALLSETSRAVAERRFIILSGELTWSDYIECDLSCRGCGQEFELRCETYHGSGGNWRRRNSG
jgi:hypothetical protein